MLRIIVNCIIFIFPWLMEKVLCIIIHLNLLNEPENLNIEQNLGTFQDDSILKMIEFQYHYAIISWIYLILILLKPIPITMNTHLY